ncbi:ESPR-type extended signal peptide-containing protein, partial [Variovorax sp. VaC1]|uniref:ESPR domain-containing protein n=1 Tax=Variovorax sp. VaC1 TaxID=3373132 RepID=UPI00374A0766
MNKVYRSVFNRKTGTWVAASEIARAHGGGGYQKSAVALAIVMMATAGFSSEVVAANAGFAGANNIGSNGAGQGYGTSSAQSVLFQGDDDYCGSVDVAGRTNIAGGPGGTGQITANQLYSNIISNTPGATGVNSANSAVWNTYTTQQNWTGDGTVSSPGRGYANAISNATARTYGVASFAWGCGASAMGNYSAAFGMASAATASTAQAYGVAALASGTAAVAMGVGSQASAESAVALGSLATADSVYGVAIGKGATVGAGATSGSVALGSGSSVTTATTGTAFLSNQAAPTNGEVNIGTRRITGVADGALPTDGATVGQVTLLSTSVSTGIASLSTSTSTGLSTATSSIGSLSTSTSTGISSLSTSTSTGLSTATSSISSLSTSTST